MGVLGKETRNIQNPALGAILLWRFVIGYKDGSEVAAHTPLPLMFTVLPVIFHKDTATFISSTLKSSGLRAFTNKFNESKTSKNDLILSIHQRALSMRNLTAKSIALGISADLIKIDSTTALAIPLSTSVPKANIANSVNGLIKGSEKLGFWCSKLTLHEISLILKVSF